MPPEPALALSSERLIRAGFAHAFFLRTGGVSAGAYASLNFAASTGDDPANVERNLGLAATELGVRRERIYFLSQVHGIGSVRLDGTEDPRKMVKVEGDATFSTTAGVACAVRSADCGTILAGDRRSGAVVAIHAGWRGTELGVVEAGFRALREALGAEGDLVVAVGPLIEKCCFEVGLDVAARLASCSPLGEDAIARRAGEKAFVDLRAILGAKLEALGVKRDAIDQVGGCTVCDRERFFSYRRDGQKSGRMMAAIVAR
jgi:YfiH family protein